MTLKPSKPQKKYRARTKKLGKQPLHIGDTLPPLSDGTLRTAADVFPDWKKLGATMDEVYFAAEYLLNGFNSTEAARYVHPNASPNSWGSFGSQYLRRPIVQQLLNDYTSAWLRGKAFELEHNLMETLEALAFYDVSKFLNPDGTLAFKNWNELPEPLRRCVEGVEVKFFGANAQRQTVSLQLAKRADALKAIANYVAIMRNGPLAQGASSGASVSAEAELVLNAVFNSGRKLDRRTPAQIRADKAREEAQATDAAPMPENAVSFSGLGCCMAFKWTPELLCRVRDYPHLLGHMVGKDRLTELHSDWIKLIWDTPAGEHASLMSHRGAYKTTAITECGIIYHLLFHPSDRIALIRETWTEAAKTLDTIKKYMESPAIKSLFAYAHQGKEPKAVKSPEGSVLFNFKQSITKENSIDAYGINQVPTGSHYDRILCDDIVTINSRLSRAKREMVKQGVLEIVTNIIDPGKSCFFVGTPWHYDDAWAMKNDDGELIIPEPWKYRPADTGILSPEELQKKRKSTTASLFAINYMLDASVRDEGQIFDEPIYGTWDWNLRPTRIHAHLDAAWDGTCTNALTIMAERPDGLIQAFGKVYPGTFNECKRDVAVQCAERHARTFHIEKNPDKGMAAGELRAIPGFPVVRAYQERMNKDIKIVSYLKRYWNRIVWDPNTDPNYLNQINDYRPGQDPRDAPDSASSLLREAFYKGGGASALYTL